MSTTIDRETLQAVLGYKQQNKVIVFTNGCFDILHVGHVRYLHEAKRLGDKLVIGINSDESVKRLKGSDRPLNSESARQEVLLALRMVDHVCIFEEDTPILLIEQIMPYVLVKGGDWPVEKIVGANLVLHHGGKVLSLPYVPGFSTSSVVEKIRRT